MVRKWKQEFLKNAHFPFSTEPDCKEAKRKEDTLKKKNDQMLKTIGQLTVERDFFQDCFRQAGAPLPKLPGYDFKEQEIIYKASMRAFIDESIQLVLCCSRAEQAAKQRRRSTDGSN